ncbi:hypothetical protein DOTSEDRAFT_38186 [Dothistroma septosporum NZE10]|uniref:Uncharacterized protein n=1 Tax=Dothistroma septosporum (strain NZE10 / CBS 128990) TaxID=675120 RepID=N1PFZ7_DOTSN|nr:hypothetical protein DOTSEDRAFT_38186 [Dothistroma septosporum NZE10]
MAAVASVVVPEVRASAESAKLPIPSGLSRRRAVAGDHSLLRCAHALSFIETHDRVRCRLVLSASANSPSLVDERTFPPRSRLLPSLPPWPRWILLMLNEADGQAQYGYEAPSSVDDKTLHLHIGFRADACAPGAPQYVTSGKTRDNGAFADFWMWSTGVSGPMLATELIHADTT